MLHVSLVSPTAIVYALPDVRVFSAAPFDARNSPPGLGAHFFGVVILAALPTGMPQPERPNSSWKLIVDYNGKKIEFDGVQFAAHIRQGGGARIDFTSRSSPIRGEFSIQDGPMP